MGSASVTILGAGSWGTALAIHLAQCGHRVRLWDRSAELIGRLARDREHTAVHPGIPFPGGIEPTADLAAACRGTEGIVFVCASHAVREVAGRVVECGIAGRPVFVSAAKGIEQVSQR